MVPEVGTLKLNSNEILINIGFKYSLSSRFSVPILEIGLELLAQILMRQQEKKCSYNFMYIHKDAFC